LVRLGVLRPKEYEGVVRIFEAIGVGEEEARLRGMHSDPRTGAEVARFASRVLSQAAEVQSDGTAAFTPHQTIRPYIQNLIEFNDSVAQLGSEAAVFANKLEMLVEILEDDLELISTAAEQQRKYFGVKASSAYREVLQDARFEPLWPRLAAFVVAENVADVVAENVAEIVEFLETVAEKASDPDVMQGLRHQAIRLRTMGL
jgi:hypothetical protein